MVIASKNDSNWYQNYEALKAYIQERGHLPDKDVVTNRSLLSWAKYQRKKIKNGTLKRSENCLKHCSPHDLQNIQGEEGRKFDIIYA